MNPTNIAIITALVMSIGQFTKFTMKLKKCPKSFPFAMLFSGVLLGVIIDFSTIGLIDGLTGGLSAMGFYSGAKHIGFEKIEESREVSPE